MPLLQTESFTLFWVEVWSVLLTAPFRPYTLLLTACAAGPGSHCKAPSQTVSQNANSSTDNQSEPDLKCHREEEQLLRYTEGT